MSPGYDYLGNKCSWVRNLVRIVLCMYCIGLHGRYFGCRIVSNLLDAGVRNCGNKK